MSLEHSKLLKKRERAELDAMYALIVQTSAAYVRDANRRGVLCRGKAVTNWFQDVDDATSQGWQAALSAMSHVLGETQSHYESAARRRDALRKEGGS